MTHSVRALVPMAPVRSVPASIAFYARLGFEIENTFTPPGQAEPSWAYLSSGLAQIMVTRAAGPVVAGAPAVLFYAYFDDVAAIREQLVAQGLEAGAIQYPFHAPRGEFRIQDPDGYVVTNTHT